MAVPATFSHPVPHPLAGGVDMEQVEHGFDWWESLKALRSVCDCGDFYPCMRMRSVFAAERRAEDEHWQRSYADELLSELGTQLGVGPVDRTHRIDAKGGWRP